MHLKYGSKLACRAFSWGFPRFEIRVVGKTLGGREKIESLQATNQVLDTALTVCGLRDG
jgi:hypothetical protein